MDPVRLNPNAYYQFSQKTSGDLLFPTHNDYLHFLFLYCRHVQPLAHTFAYCLLPDSFYVLVQIRDEVSLQRHTERVQVGIEEIADDYAGYLKRQIAAFVAGYHTSLSAPAPSFAAGWQCEHLPTSDEAAHRLELLHLYPLYFSTSRCSGLWPYTSLHSLQSRRHTFLDRDTVHGWFGGQEGFLKESREIYLQIS